MSNKDEITNETGNQNVIVHRLDLSSFKSIREFATKVKETESKIDVLIHNAGYSNWWNRVVTDDGIEMTMATNHYGPFLLTHLLIDLLKKAAPSRIVVVASKTHTLSYMNPFNKNHLNPIHFLLPMFLYGNSKYANILFTFELARRLKGSNITANCLHPGVIDTGIFRNIPFPFSFFVGIHRQFMRTLQEGIQTTLHCAMSPQLKDVTGKYFRNCREGTPHSGVHDRSWQAVLWEESCKIVKLTEKDPQI